MWKFFFFIMVVVFVGSTELATAKTVYCTNCSSRFVQALDRVTNAKQLATLMRQYTEDVLQTAHQARMVQQNIEQIANMIKNTDQLSEHELRRLKNRFVRLGRLVGRVTQQRGEVKALEQVWRATYPEWRKVKDIVRKGKNIGKEWGRWSRRVDEATMATFQMSGEQLAEISDSTELDAHIQDLLTKPEGRMQALQAANQLSAVQIEESRMHRALLATYVQQQAQTASKAEKENQVEDEQWEKLFSSDVLDGTKNTPPAQPPTF